ncbi:unnamed protein product [Sympodiomycopsis kandeliae]
MWPFSNGSSSAASSSSSSPANSNPDTPPSSFVPEQQQQPQSATSYFSSPQASYSTSHTTAGGQSADTSTYQPTAASLFSSPDFDTTRLHPLAGLSRDDVEYLDIVDEQTNQLEGARTALPSRGWSDDLCYGTGTTYLSGLALGGLVGATEGLRRPLGVQSPTTRLRLNAILNQVTRRGSFMGNSAGVIALIYNSIDAIIDNSRGKHDIYGAVAAGGISGALFKCTAGVRPMAISSGIMMAAAAGWTTAKQALL